MFSIIQLNKNCSHGKKKNSFQSKKSIKKSKNQKKHEQVLLLPTLKSGLKREDWHFVLDGNQWTSAILVSFFSLFADKTYKNSCKTRENGEISCKKAFFAVFVWKWQLAAWTLNINDGMSNCVSFAYICVGKSLLSFICFPLTSILSGLTLKLV